MPPRARGSAATSGIAATETTSRPPVAVATCTITSPACGVTAMNSAWPPPRGGVRSTRSSLPAHGLVAAEARGRRQVERDLPGDLSRQRARQHQVQVVCLDREPVDQAEGVLPRPGVQTRPGRAGRRWSRRQAGRPASARSCPASAPPDLSRRQPRSRPADAARVSRAAAACAASCDVAAEHLGQRSPVSPGAGRAGEREQQPRAERRGDVMPCPDGRVQPRGVARYAGRDLSRLDAHAPTLPLAPARSAGEAAGLASGGPAAGWSGLRPSQK